MNSTHWRQRLSVARDAGAVVGVARDFLAEWTPDQLAALPESCRPGAMSDGDDLNAYAFTLVHAQTNDPQSAAPLDAFATFFAAATARVALILAQAQGAAPRRFLTK